MKTIDVHSPLPKYQQLRSALLEMLRLNQQEIGQLFCSENELAKMFNVSPLTARKALSSLEREGLLKRKQGVGTFVLSLPKCPRKLSVVEDCSIGILVGDLEEERGNIAFQKVLFGAERESLDKGYLLQIARLSNPNLLPRMVTGKHIDGLIIVGKINDEIARQLKSERMPVVLIGEYSPVYDFHTINNDCKMAGYQVARYFLGLGHKKIGLVAGSCHPADISSCILAGFREAFSENKGLFKKKLIRIDPKRNDYRLTKELLNNQEKVTALFLGTWIGVTQSLQAISEKGLKIPEDISVVGYGDNVMVMQTKPALTAVKLFSEKIGEKAVELLLDVIKDPARTPKKNYYPTEIIKRNSCRALS